MKKSLFLTLALACAMSGFAQTPKMDASHISWKQMSDMPNQVMERADANKPSRPMRTFANGVYYTIPGALYTGWGPDGSGYIVSQAVVPPFVDVTFQNMKKDKTNNLWTWNTQDFSQYAEENGDMVMNFNPKGYWYTFSLGSTNSTTSYQFNEDNYWVATGSRETNAISLLSTVADYFGDPLSLTATDIHGHTVNSNGQPSRNTLSGWGFLSTDFLFGTGDAGDEGDPDMAFGFEQTYNPLLAPLYIDEIHVMGLTYNQSGPIPEGKSLKAYLLAIDEEAGTSETIATFEALSGDTLDFKDSSPQWGNRGDNKNKTAYFGTVIFRNVECVEDIFGNKSPLPAAIPAGTSWSIQIEGVNEEGVNLGVYGVINSDIEASYIPQGHVLTEKGYAHSYISSISPLIEIFGQYEMIDVTTKDFLSAESQPDFPADKFNGWNVIRVSADGQDVSTDGLEGTDYNMGVAFVGTTIDWFDENGSANYDINWEEAPEWLTEILVDTTQYNRDAITGYNMVLPVCAALPEGVTGRQCVVDVVGYADIPGNNKIVILQGDAQFTPDGIEEIMAANKEGRKSDNKIYGLDGKRLTRPVSGQLFIKNGKKFIRK